MKKISLWIFICFCLSACAGTRPTAPSVSLYGFTENNYPCFSLEFPDQIRYEGMKLHTKEKEAVVAYKVLMPNYHVDVIKMYSDKGGWSSDNLPSMKTKNSKVYEIADIYNTPEKSAVITMEEIDGKLYLKGSIGEFIQNDRALRVDIYREIKRFSVFRQNAAENWKNSTTGYKTIENMKVVIDYLYKNMAVVDCKYKDTIDTKWWK